jgi:hypothetical protein
MSRVLRHGGLIYLAVPNRWALREPHYRLWFLSWLPAPVRSVYVRLGRKGKEYDCHPPGPIGVRRLFRSAGLKYEQLSVPALELMGEIENKPWVARFSRSMPHTVKKSLAPTLPTMIFALRKNPGTTR